MVSTVKVVFGAESEYEFRIEQAEVDALGSDRAREWLDMQYEAQECAPSSPVGKTLVLDQILDLTRAIGERKFMAGGELVQQFAKAAAAALGKDLVRIDVPGNTVGY